MRCEALRWTSAQQSVRGGDLHVCDSGHHGKGGDQDNKGYHLETKHAGSSLPQRKHQRRGHGREYIRSVQRRGGREGSIHITGSHNAALGTIDDLLAEDGPPRSQLCDSFARMQV